MALQGSMGGGASKATRLSKMSSVPTTEDLRYALAESKKNNKPVELPFENNRALFIIKVHQQGNATPRWTFQRGDGATARIIWTRDSAEVLMIQNKIKTESAYDGNLADNSNSGYQQAYGGGATSGYQQAYEEPSDQGYGESYDESAEMAAYGGAQPSVPPASMGFGAAPGSGFQTSQSFGGGGIPAKGFGVQQEGATSQSGMPAWQPQPSNSQQGMQAQGGSSIPQQSFASQGASGRQVPFQPTPPEQGGQAAPGGAKILMPPKLAGFNSAEFNAAMNASRQDPDSAVQNPQAALAQAPPAQHPGLPQQSMPPQQYAVEDRSAYVDPVYQGADKLGDEKKVQFDMSGIFGETPAPVPATASGALPERGDASVKPKVALPPAVPIDHNLINGVHARLADSRTGLFNFDSLLYFLSREYNRYQKNKATGLGLMLMDVQLQQNNQLIPLPPEAIVPVAQRIQQAGTPVDVAAHISGNEFAILLDYSDHFALTRFADALYRALTDTPLFPNWPPDSTNVVIGIATIPHTTDQLGILVAAAQQAKEMAKTSTPRYKIFPN